ncbi:type II toxin-antitoxin system VapC family toxin [Homoserinibacter sp. YIM 151385]|uniref:type II toxin-antitoxin system VapC family toxin n=1 Tax=Homoserinibacter sp. YIM 151385 TaxID=2985506 RepID=UPI0022F042CD|nr:PIN domain-containing protein [Homoserinibacter sp. YIM 151385]WBU36944.1 PIN domain-containing protein [Homoserinibacter sp. YIM 151385]
MIVLDASVMIAWLRRVDAHHASARRIFLDHVDERLVAHRLTLAESLVGAAGIGRVVEAASSLDAVGIGRLDEPDDPVELAVLRARTGLRLPDACVLLAARRDHAGLATFDAKLAAAARLEGVAVIGAA